MHDAMQDEVTHALFVATFIAVLLDGSDRQRHRINEYAILHIFPGTGPGGMCEVFLGVVDVACGDAHEVATQLECVLMSWIPDRDWWAKGVVTFAVDGASNLGVRGASARQVVDVSIIESNVFALIGKWLVLMTPLGEPCHVVQRKLGLVLEAGGPTHVDILAAVNRQRGLYNGARQWKELQKCVQKHVQDKCSGLPLIPTSHRIRWSQAHARRNTAFLANVPWVARHLDSKVLHSIKEEDVWEDCHDASLLAWGVVYGDILHGMRCFKCGTTTCAHWCTLCHCNRYARSPVAEGGSRGGSRVVAIQGADCDRCVAWCAVGPTRFKWVEVCNNPSFSRRSSACSD